jgi:PD-(D/E)XK endonuclease
MWAAMEKPWTPRRQGDAGELSAMFWLMEAGAIVAIPLVPHSDYDLLADWGDRVERVQVKTSSCRVRDRYVLQLSTRGGNQSWNRTIKYLDSSRCDCVFAHVADGRRWLIPARALGGSSAITLGGPKYSEFEVDRGPPLPERHRSERHPTLDSTPRRGSEVVKRSGL